MKQEQISMRQFNRIMILETGSIACLYVTLWAGRENGILIVLLSIIGSLLYGGFFMAIGRLGEGYCPSAEQVLPGMVWRLLFLSYMIRFAIRGAWILSYLEYMIETTLFAGNQLMILIPLLIVCGYAGVRNLEGRARFVELLFWWVLIPLAGIFLIGLWKADLSLLTPKAEVSIRELLTGEYRLMPLYLPLELLLFRVTTVRGDARRVWCAGMRAILVSGLWMLLVYSVTVGITGIVWSSNRLSSVTDAMEQISIRGGGLERIDILLILIWLVGGIITLSGYCFQGKQLLARILPTKAPAGILSLGMVVLVQAIYFCFPDVESWSQWYLKYACWVDLPLSIGLPLVVAGFGWLKRRKKNQVHPFCIEKAGQLGVKEFGVVLLLVLLAGGCSGCAGVSSIEDRTYVESLHIREVSGGYEYRCKLSYMDARAREAFGIGEEEDIKSKEYAGTAVSVEEFNRGYAQLTGSRLDYSHLEGIYLDADLYSMKASETVFMRLWEETQVVLSTPIYQEELPQGEQRSETLGDRLKQTEEISGKISEEMPEV